MDGSMRLLIVEDNPEMGRFLRQGLVEAGYAVDVEERGFPAEERAVDTPYSLIVLDLMLPDEDGTTVCRNLRRRGVKSLVLVLSVLSSTREKIEALNAGADDYMVKPFEFDELLARVHALLRRGQSQEGAVLRAAGLELDLSSHKARRDGTNIHLSNKEFSLLEFFMRNPGRVLSRATIGEHVWDMNFSSDSNVIDVYVGLLRRKVDRTFDGKLIHTVVGRGYYFGTPPPGQ